MFENVVKVINTIPFGNGQFELRQKVLRMP